MSEEAQRNVSDGEQEPGREQTRKDRQLYIRLLTELAALDLPAKTSPCLLTSQADRHRTCEADWLSG